MLLLPFVLSTSKYERVCTCARDANPFPQTFTVDMARAQGGTNDEIDAVGPKGASLPSSELRFSGYRKNRSTSANSRARRAGGSELRMSRP